MSYGLALAGGGARGAAHVGVLLALEENGLLPSSIAGTSVGSIIAGLYASGMTPAELRELVKALSKMGYFLIDPDFSGVLKAVVNFFTNRPVALSGLIKGNKLERYFNKLTDGRNIRDAELKTVIPAVDINSGNTVVFTDSLKGIAAGKGVQWETDIPISCAIRASIAVPAIFCPKIIGNMCLVDGGVTDNLPVNLLTAAGEPNILAVDISDHYKVPEQYNIVEIASHSLSVMSGRLKNCTGAGEKLLLKPNLPDNAGLLTFQHMVECMDIGYEATITMIPAIKSLFS